MRNQWSDNEVIRGLATNTAFRSGSLLKRDFFVGRVDPVTEIDEIYSYLDDIGLSDYNLEQVSYEGSRFKAYKLTVNLSDVDIVHSPNVWPLDVIVKKFRFPGPGRGRGNSFDNRRNGRGW